MMAQEENMKRIGWLFCLSLALAAVGCQSKAGQTILTEEDNGQTITVAAGSEIVIKLEGNITTGYSWSVQDLDAQYLQQQGEEEYKSESDLIGAGGVSTFTFKAMQSGQTTLKMIYSRPFEKDTPPEKVFEISVDIQ